MRRAQRQILELENVKNPGAEVLHRKSNEYRESAKRLQACALSQIADQGGRS